MKARLLIFMSVLSFLSFYPEGILAQNRCRLCPRPSIHVFNPYWNRIRPIYARPTWTPMPSPVYLRGIQQQPVREYPSRINSRQEDTSYRTSSADNSAELQDIYHRLDNLEQTTREMKEELSKQSQNNAFSDEKYQRLMDVERDMKNLKSILIELKEYLKSRR